MDAIDAYLFEEQYTTLFVNPVKVHLGLIWNDEALGFFEEVDRPNKKNNKMNSDMRSVPGP